VTACDRILQRLRAVGFETQRGPLSVFEDDLPMLVGAAWDERTAQLAMLVDVDPSQERDALRQLLFAIGGLRHQISADGPIAIGSPLALLIVDNEGEELVRSLVEEISRDYVVFTRLDLSLVRRDAVSEDDALDDALAPLLPRCRQAQSESISKADVLQFWDRLRRLIREAADDLDDIFASSRKAAARAAADALIGDLADRPSLAAPKPLSAVEIKNFRSFSGQPTVEMAPITIVHGANGTGKSALLEALEICWAQTSQRKPPDVEASEYERHLAHDGEGGFELVGDGKVFNGITIEPDVELVRCVLTQDSAPRFIEQSPKRRFANLLAITGLELPELDQRTDNLVRDAKKHVDVVMRDAGLPPLRAITSDGVKHLNDNLRQAYVPRLPSLEELMGLEDVLARASAGAYVRFDWTSTDLVTTLEKVDEMLAGAPLGTEPDRSLLNASAQVAKEAAAARRQRARAMRGLVRAIHAARPEGPEEEPDESEQELVPEIPRRLAVRWLGHGRALELAASAFEEEGEQLATDSWLKRLNAYTDGLRKLAAEVPRKELDVMIGAASVNLPLAAEPVDVPEDVYRAAGFSRTPDKPNDLVDPIEEYVALLEGQTTALDSVGTSLENHPSKEFSAHCDRVLDAMCGFELARRLRPRKGRVEPIEKASEEEVEELLNGRLAPIVRELLVSLVRFEWYFNPPKISGKKGELEIGGIATARADLDARLVLNAAERSVFGLAWFLALYLLQPDERRQVLAIDDASAAFDSTNQAAFVSTLRALVRMVRPKQVVLCSHDSAVAESLMEELAPVDGWPTRARRVRCERDQSNLSRCEVVEGKDGQRDLTLNLKRLGLVGEMPTFA
jgi:hypothetical protein